MTKDHLKDDGCDLGKKLGKEAPADQDVHSMLQLDNQSSVKS